MRIGNSGIYPVFWLPTRNRNLNTERTRLEKFKAPEFKYQAERVNLDEITPIKSADKIESTQKLLKKNKIKWLNELYNQRVSYGQIIVDIQSLGYTEAESKEILDEAMFHSERATSWAIDNEYYGNIAANSIVVSTVIGLANILVNQIESKTEDELLPQSVKQALNLTHNGSYALRGYVQYGKIYGGRFDDDRARNKYEAEEYGNKIAGLFGDLAYIFETSISPVSLIALSFLSKNTQETFTPLLSFINPLWWRIRMPAEINQEFATDLISYLLNKPLALFQIESSVKKIRELKDRGNLNYNYVSKRLIELAGLDSDTKRLKDIFPELAKLLKNLFNDDKKTAFHSSITISKLFAPILGLYGFFAMGIGVPLKSILSYFEKESKYINALAQSGSASQQLLYLFRMMLPEKFENVSKENNNDSVLKRFLDERNHLFHAGLTTCATNVLSTLLKIINSENSYFKFGSGFVNEVAEKGIAYYFSKRRSLLGKKFKLENPELYNIDGTAKIISDKVKEQGYKLQSVEGVAG